MGPLEYSSNLALGRVLPLARLLLSTCSPEASQVRFTGECMHFLNLYRYYQWFPEHWPQGILTPEHWPQELWPKGISIPRNLAQRNFAPNGKLTQRNFAHRNFDLRNIHPNGNFTQRNFDQWSTEVPSEVWSTVCILIIFWNYLYPVLQSSYEENCSTKISYQFVECSIASFERFSQSK